MSARFTTSDLQSVWRILCAVAGFQIVGGLIGLAIGYHHFWFFNFWMGGALFTLPGYFVGYKWQSRSESDTRNEWLVTAIYTRLLAIGVVVFGVLAMLPMMIDQTRRLAELKEFDEVTVNEIEVFDDDSLKRIETINDPEVLSAFASAITDAEGYAPNHPSYSRSWHIVVNARKRYQFDLHFDPECPDVAIGYWVSRSPAGSHNFGSFSSRGLRKWAEENLP